VADARGALQSVWFACSILGVTTSDRPLGIGCSFKVPGPLKYRPYWLSGPTLPLAVSSAVWFSSHGFRWSLFSVQSSPLFEFRLPLEYYPAKPSQPAAADQLLSWALVPYSTSGIEGPPDAGSPARYVPPSGFGYPLDGLLPSVPCRFCFTPAALLGFTLRRFPSRKVSGVLPPGGTHLPLSPAVFPPPKRRAGPMGLGFWVLSLPRVPGDQTRV
jgi:hypothetical protein